MSKRPPHSCKSTSSTNSQRWAMGHVVWAPERLLRLPLQYKRCLIDVKVANYADSKHVVIVMVCFYNLIWAVMIVQVTTLIPFVPLQDELMLGIESSYEPCWRWRWLLSKWFTNTMVWYWIVATYRSVDVICVEQSRTWDTKGQLRRWKCVFQRLYPLSCAPISWLCKHASTAEKDESKV